MMRLRRASAIAALCVFASAARRRRSPWGESRPEAPPRHGVDTTPGSGSSCTRSHHSGPPCERLEGYRQSRGPVGDGSRSPGSADYEKPRPPLLATGPMPSIGSSSLRSGPRLAPSRIDRTASTALPYPRTCPLAEHSPSTPSGHATIGVDHQATSTDELYRTTRSADERAWIRRCRTTRSADEGAWVGRSRTRSPLRRGPGSQQPG